MDDEVLRRTFTVTVTWSQPKDQDHTSDWGATICDSLMDSPANFFDIEEGPLVELIPNVREEK